MWNKWAPCFACYALLATVSASAGSLFGQVFSGDLTYYGDQKGAGQCSFQNGATQLPWTQSLTGAKYVALDAPLYSNPDGSAAACGMCIALYGDNPSCSTCGGDPVPSAVQYAMVVDECPGKVQPNSNLSTVVGTQKTRCATMPKQNRPAATLQRGLLYFRER